MRWLIVIFSAAVLLHAQEEDQGCETARRHTFTLRHIEAKGIGYDKGYSTLELFLAPHNDCSRFIPIIDLRGHIFNNGKGAFNTGLGGRYLFNSWIGGFNVFYDFRQGPKRNYNMMGAGLEWLGRRWECRANGYWSIAKNSTGPFDVNFDRFQGNNIVLKYKQNTALSGFDSELGYNFPITCHTDWFFGLGPYYLTGKFGKNSWGGQARLTGTALDYLRLTVSASYDSLFRTIVQGEFGITIPLGKRDKVAMCRATCPYLLEDRLYQPIIRKEIVPVKKASQQALAINPATGLPYFVIFVDNTSSSLGTFESPFNTLAAAQAASHVNDIIYLFPGTGAALTGGIVLKNFQRLLGSAHEHPISSQLGTITIPVFSDVMPTVTSTGNVITLASQNEVSGIHLTGPSLSNVIFGENIFGTNINNNIINESTGVNAIQFSSVQGIILVNNNLISANPNTSSIDNGVQILGNTSAFIIIKNNKFSHVSVPITYNTTNHANEIHISNNEFVTTGTSITFVSSGSSASNLKILIDQNISTAVSFFTYNITDTITSVNATIAANQALSTGQGLQLTTGTYPATFSVQGNTFLSGGVSTNFSGSTSFKMIGNNFRSSGTPFSLQQGTGGSSKFCILGNTLVHVTQGTISSSGPTTLCVKYQGNQDLPTNHVTFSQSNPSVFRYEPFIANTNESLVISGTATQVADGTCGCSNP